MRKLQSQGVHHITIVGADRQTSIDFWEGVLGMPFVFEQPNLDNESESHLYFDPGDGRLITVFTNEERVEMIREVTSHLKNVQVDYFSGLTAEYARQRWCNLRHPHHAEVPPRRVDEVAAADREANGLSPPTGSFPRMSSAGRTVAMAGRWMCGL